MIGRRGLLGALLASAGSAAAAQSIVGRPAALRQSGVRLFSLSAPTPGVSLPAFSSATTFGDSVTQGFDATVAAKRWPNLLTGAMGATLNNRGISGNAVQDLRARFVTDTQGVNKSVQLIIMIGINDATQPQGTTFTLTNFRKFYSEILNGEIANGGYAPQNIVLGTPSWINPQPAIYPDYRQVVLDLATEYGTYYCDTFTAMQSAGGDTLLTNGTGLHPNDAGHQVISDAYLYSSRVPNARTGARPSIANASPAGGQLSWTISPAGPAASSYTVGYALDDALAYTDSAPSAATSGAFTGLPAGWYRVRVRANYGDGSSSPWSFSSAAVAVRPVTGTTPFWDSFFNQTAVFETASGDLVFPAEPADTGRDIKRGLRQGDVVFADISARGNAAFTLPAGWSLAAPQQSGGNTSTSAASSIGSGLLAWCIRGAAPLGSPGEPGLTFARTGGDLGMGRLRAYRGWGGTPSVVSGTSNTIAAASMTVTTPALTITRANALLVATAAVCNNNAVSSITAATDPTTATGALDTTTAPTAGTWIKRADTLTSTGADGALATADAIKASPGSTGQLQYTDANTQRSVMLAAAVELVP